jgi:hypothetical protein
MTLRCTRTAARHRVLETLLQILTRFRGISALTAIGLIAGG